MEDSDEEDIDESYQMDPSGVVNASKALQDHRQSSGINSSFVVPETRVSEDEERKIRIEAQDVETSFESEDY